MGHGGDHPRAPPRPAVASRHRRGGPGLVDEHQPLPGLSTGCCARQACLTAATSGRSRSAARWVLFSSQPRGDEEPADRRAAHGDPCGRQPAAQLGDREIRLGRQERVHRLRCAASVERLRPPIGSACTVPRWRQRCSSVMTKLGLTSNLAAVARRDAPAIETIMDWHEPSCLTRLMFQRCRRASRLGRSGDRERQVQVGRRQVPRDESDYRRRPKPI